jgi:hypothetical protein
LRLSSSESCEEFDELFELELLEEFDELFELELLEEFDELFELELLEEFDELFELESSELLELELPATRVSCPRSTLAASKSSKPSFGTPATAPPAVVSAAPTIEAKKILRFFIFISLIRLIAYT